MDIHLYRWLEVVAGQDASVATGRTAAFHEKADGGLGKFVKQKEVDLRLPVSVATKFQGEKSEFVYGGELTGSQTVNWLYEGELEEEKEDFLKVQVGGLEVGQLVARANQPVLAPGVYIGYRPFPTLSNPKLDKVLDTTLGRAKHLTIILVPSNSQDVGSSGLFNNPQQMTGEKPYGLLSGWFGDQRNWCGVELDFGSPLPLVSIPWDFSNLTALFNDSRDRISQLEDWVKVDIPNGQDETQFIEKLIQAAREYNQSNNALYFGVPSIALNHPTYNSNSFVSGVVQKAGGRLPDLGFGLLEGAPGAERPLPIPFIPTTTCEQGLEG